MTQSLEKIEEARQALKDRDWGRARPALRTLFPACANSKFIADALQAGVKAHKDNEVERAEQLYRLAIDIYNSGRDENFDVLVAIKQLSDILARAGRKEELAELREQTFELVLTAADGLLRSIRFLNRQLAEKDQKDQ